MPVVVDSQQEPVAIIESPSYQERVLFLGANGSGKTILASQMLRPYPRAVVLDIKYDFPIPWDKGDYVIVTRPPNNRYWLSWLIDKWQSNHIIYRPQPPYDSGEWVTYFLNRMFDRGRREGKKKPFILYLDEGGWASYNGAKLAIARLSISGRSIGIGLWISAQRPRGIPVEVRSEAWRTYVFYLRKEDDRRELVQVLDDRVDESYFANTAVDYGFTEAKRGKGGAIEYRRLPPLKIESPETEEEK